MEGNVVSVGMDLVDLDRVDKILSRYGLGFAERICTPAEIIYCFSLVNPVPSLAARFAAKEAVSKALGTGIGVHCSWRDIEITRSGHGVPGVLLHGKAEIVALKLGINSWRISLTHSKYSAAALVLALK